MKRLFLAKLVVTAGFVAYAWHVHRKFAIEDEAVPEDEIIGVQIGTDAYTYFGQVHRAALGDLKDLRRPRPVRRGGFTRYDGRSLTDWEEALLSPN